jgi:hypothetical protein
MPANDCADSPRRNRRLSLLAAVAALTLVAAACSDDSGDEASTQDAFCDSADTLRASLDSLFGLDLIAEGTSGVSDALDHVVDDADALKDNATEAAADEVEALETAIDDAEDALGELAGSLNADNASSVVSAVGEIQNAATAVYDTLTDCP